MQVYTWTSEEMESNLQIAKHTLIQNLYDRGKIDKETYTDYTNNYALLMRRPSFFSSFWSTLAGKKQGEDNMRFILVRQESIDEATMKAEKDEK
jgi:hypothetical protein